MEYSFSDVGSTLLGLNSIPLFVAYLAMVFFSRFLPNYSPPELRMIMILYNVITSAVSGYIVYLFIVNWLQVGTLYAKRQEHEGIKVAIKLYWFSKIWELLDTVWMVVRRRQRQVTFLHVYHHSSMLLLTDFAYNYTPWVSMTVPMSLNSAVHVVMYLYYGLAAMGYSPSWKRYITTMQLSQFYILMVYCGYGFFKAEVCVWANFYTASMIILFSDFYKATYKLKKNSKKST